MKSAYELAMARLEKQAPTRQLTAEQKAAIAEIESTCRARIAERELLLTGEMKKALAKGSISDKESLDLELARDIRRLNEDCETKKAKIRDAS